MAEPVEHADNVVTMPDGVRYELTMTAEAEVIPGQPDEEQP
jgi:hypothetical protein